MAHTYAGILGLLAFLVSLTRGMLHGAPAAAAAWTAWCHLLVFGLIGLALGRIAQAVVDDAVRGRIAAELAAEKPTEHGATPSGRPA